MTKLKIKKVVQVLPTTKQRGFTARVITNGTAGYDEIVAEACKNTTVHKAEAKVSLELCMEAVAEKLKQGYIVDLGPVGRLYPSCNSGWVATADEVQLQNVKPSLYYRAADEVAGAIRAATLQWAKDDEDDAADSASTGGTSTGDASGSSDVPVVERP